MKETKKRKGHLQKVLFVKTRRKQKRKRIMGWIKKKVDDFLWWLDGDMNFWFLILALVFIIWLGTVIYVLATGGEIKAPKTQPIIYLPLMR